MKIIKFLKSKYAGDAGDEAQYHGTMRFKYDSFQPFQAIAKPGKKTTIRMGKWGDLLIPDEAREMILKAIDDGKEILPD